MQSILLCMWSWRILSVRFRRILRNYYWTIPKQSQTCKLVFLHSNEWRVVKQYPSEHIYLWDRVMLVLSCIPESKLLCESLAWMSSNEIHLRIQCSYLLQLMDLGFRAHYLLEVPWDLQNSELLFYFAPMGQPCETHNGSLGFWVFFSVTKERQYQTLFSFMPNLLRYQNFI